MGTEVAGDNQEEDNLEQDSLGPEGEDNHRAVHMQAVDTQPKEVLVDQCVTSAELEAQPLVDHQICHPACPFQSCVASACMHKPCNTPDQPYTTAIEKPLEFHHFQQSLQLWKICMLFVGGRT